VTPQNTNGIYRGCSYAGTLRPSYCLHQIFASTKTVPASAGCSQATGLQPSFERKLRQLEDWSNESLVPMDATLW